jgi:hypothetical protein
VPSTAGLTRERRPPGGLPRPTIFTTKPLRSFGHGTTGHSNYTEMQSRGVMVARCCDDGRIREIAEYCESDVVNTYRLWLRYELFRGRLSEPAFRTSACCPNFQSGRGRVPKFRGKDGKLRLV